MRRREPVTHVEVSRETREKLKEKKDELGVRSVDAVIQHFLSGPQDDGEEESSSDNEGEDSGEPEKRRKVNVREELYSLEILSEREGMLEYYTGFDRSDVDLLVRRFSEVRRERVFFPLLLFGRNARSRYDPCATISCPTCRSSNRSFLIGGRATTGIGSWIWPIESSCFLLG
jgi:hypothetical protein